MSIILSREMIIPKVMPDPVGYEGDITIWDGKEWLICHIDYVNNVKYLIAKDIISLTAFGSDNTYSGSTLASIAADYQSNNMSEGALSRIVDTTVNGVTSKVFVPSSEQMDGGFRWFNSSNNRKAYYNGYGSAEYYWYWTSSKRPDIDNVYYVDPDGRSYYDDTPNMIYGFRPCIAVRCKKPIPIPPFPAPSSHTPGDVITWDDKTWLVCHYDSSNNQVYLIANDIISETEFGSNLNYAGSTLASVAASYQSNNISAAALAKCVDVTVNGVTAKVFVPSYQQMNGGFSWFNSSTNRIAQYQGSATVYWTSSARSSDGVWRVSVIGNFVYYGSSNSNGFRPCVCVQL